MLKADVCDDGQDGSDDVRAVEASAKANLNDRYVHLLLLEILKSQGRCEFKEGETTLQPFSQGGSLHVFHEVDYALLGNHLAVDTYSLAKVHQVRTGV